MTRYVIEIARDNQFNEGWLAYILGFPFADFRSADWADGWKMAEETESFEDVRFAFEARERLKEPALVITRRDRG